MRARYKILILIISYIVLRFIQTTFVPLSVADSTMLQLEDSDVAYTGFKGVQSFAKHYWALYILPLLMFIPEIKALFKRQEQ